MKTMQAVILSAGKSTRTYPLTLTRPKALLPIANRPILSHQLEALQGIVKEAIIIVWYQGDMIQKKYGNYFGNIKLIFIEQRDQLGTGHALLQARGLLKKRFLVLNGDDLYGHDDLKKLAKTRFGILVKEAKDIQRFGAVIVQQGRVVKIIEKPEKPVTQLANTGAYCFETDIFAEKIEKSARGEYEITDYVNRVAAKQKVLPVIVKECWIPVGRPWDMLAANEYVLNQMRGQTIKGEIEKGVMIKGAVKIGKGTVIKSGTYIEGPVVIGENCEIGPHAYLRSHTSIGDGCRIRAEVVDSILMVNVTAKHFSYIGHSVIGEDCNIAAGVVTADYRHDEKTNVILVKGQKVDTGRRKLGAFLGDRVKTGINTCIYPGRMIWPDRNTLPGEVVDKDIE